MLISTALSISFCTIKASYCFPLYSCLFADISLCPPVSLCIELLYITLHLSMSFTYFLSICLHVIIRRQALCMPFIPLPFPPIIQFLTQPTFNHL